MQISIRRGEPCTAHFLSQMLRDPIVNQFSSPDFSTSINRENRNILLSAGLSIVQSNFSTATFVPRRYSRAFFFSSSPLSPTLSLPLSLSLDNSIQLARSFSSLRNCLIAANFFFSNFSHTYIVIRLSYLIF